MNKFICYFKEKISNSKNIMWKSFKFTTFLFILLFLVFFLFFKDSLLNIGHMTAIRVLRGAVFTWISLVLLQKILDFSFLNQHSQKKK